MNNMSEKFSLKWNDFQTNVSKTFSQLRSEEEFFDVSLVSDDQKMMSAHKLVLSASSPYFKHILTTNKHSHPLLCLDGVSSAELQCVLDYIYQGEVQIYQEQLDRFLVVAQRLQLEGLIIQDVHQERKMKIETSEIQGNTFQDNIEAEEHERVDKEDFKSETLPSKTIPKQYPASKLVFSENFMDLNDKEIAQKIDQKVAEYLLRGEDGSYSCGVCGKAGNKDRKAWNQKQIISNHIESHMEGLSFCCQICGKIFRSRPSIRGHKTKYH